MSVVVSGALSWIHCEWSAYERVGTIGLFGGRWRWNDGGIM